MSSVGQISLDLNVNSKAFERQVDGIQKKTSKAFNTLSVAVGNMLANMIQNALSGLGNFVKDAIDKGSELAELENVVTSVFTTMADKVETFSKQALSNFGLTEAQAKKMMGTFGAMSKSFGYTEQQAYNMSVSLTGLAADIASFYNLDHNEAYNKIKAVFTGETESLKELGVVMTQTALDQFALANGFGKVSSAMNEQEKVALRFAFVQDKLKVASGDFLKTQDQWANQTRILTGQFESFKAAIGQGLINVLTPVIRMLNTLMAKLIQVAQAFKSFTAMIMGVEDKTGGTGAVMKEVAAAADEAANSTGGIENSAEGAAKAAKKAQKALMGFDEINKLTKADAGAEDTSGSGFSFDSIDFGGAVASQEKVASEAIDGLKGKLNEVLALFKKGFKSGLGSDFEMSLARTKDHAIGINRALKDIFTDSDIGKSAETMAEKFAFAFGQVLGAVANVGATAGELLVGSLDTYLNKNEGYIKDRVVGTMDITGDYFKIMGDFYSSVGSIFEVFRGGTAKQIGGDLIGIFANARLGIMELMANVGYEVVNVIATPIMENEGKIKVALENTLKPIGKILSTLNKAVKNTFETVFKVIETKIRPAFKNIVTGLSQVVSTVLDAYNTHIAPVIDSLASKFTTLWSTTIQPIIDKFINHVAKIIELVSILWKNIWAPFISWLVSTIVPAITPIIEGVITMFMGLFKSIAAIIDGLMSTLGGLVDFIAGVLTGDWSRAWGGIKDIFEGICNTIKGIVSGVWEAIVGVFRNAINVIKGIVEVGFGIIKSIIEGIMNAIKGVIQGVVNGILGIINGIFGAIEFLVNGVISAVNFIIKAINKLSFDVPDWVPGIGGEKFGFNLKEMNNVQLPRLAQGGYVKANQPQPVIIGDNKTQGEIVSPEGKMLEVVISALEQFFGKLMNAGYNMQPADAGDIVIPIYLDGTMLDEVIVTAQQRRNVRSGGR